MSDRRLLESVADAVAAGEAVDWPDVERAAAKTRDADLLRQLRVVSAIGAKRGPHASPGTTWWSRCRESCVSFVLCMAAVQLALAILSGPAAFGRVAWLHIANILMFGVGGVVLLAGGGRDSRLPLLGGLFVTIGSAFAVTLMPSPEADPRSLAATFRLLLPETFLPLMLWRFVREFPVDVQRPRVRRPADVFVNVSFSVGALLFTMNAIGDLGDWKMSARSLALLALVERNDAVSAYWPLLFAIAAPAIPYLMWKSRFARYEDRRRVMLFVGALAVGLAPFVVAVVATPFVPALRDGLVQQRVGPLLYAALASIVPVTAYSVAVDRVMDLRFFIRSTLKYATARYAVWVMSLGPIAYMAFDIYSNQLLTIAQYVERSRPVGPLAFSAVGLVTLTLRQHLLRAIDRWFLVEPSDQSRTLARLEKRFRMASSLRGVTEALAGELRRAMYAPSVAVLLVNDDGTVLIPVEGTTSPIRRESTLVEILRSMRKDVQFDARTLGSIGRLLLPADREWLRNSGAQLLAPLIGATGTLLGMVAIGVSGSGRPYAAPHCALLTAACGRAAMQIENRRLRGREGGETRTREIRGERGLNWPDEPAAQCPACSLVWSPETPRCSCGAATIDAALPLFIQGKFRLERQVGAGGMGVVYCAVDMVLDRKVAIKTLPTLRTKSVERLHREARAMAHVLHPNLALVYGTERWHGTPMLVAEYLDGGTLRDWIRRGPLPYGRAIDLGIALADALDRVHGAGVLHRDVKPSNIGYTRDGLPKLLDFGLALLGSTGTVRSAGPRLEGAREALDRSTDPGATVSVAERLVGTPLYLAPEALAGATPQPSFDLWGLALVLYEALAGHHPFAAEDAATVLAAVEKARVPDVRDYRPGCPAGLASLLRSALSRDIPQRPRSASAMRADLQRLRATVAQHAS